MSHSLKQTSSPTVGREQNERKEGKVCSAVFSLHHTCKIELGHKDLTLWGKLEALSLVQWRDRGMAVLKLFLLIHSDARCSFTKYQKAWDNQVLRLSRGALLIRTILHSWIFSLTSGNKCPGHKYITAESCSYVWYARGIRLEFHIGMLVEKSTYCRGGRMG